MRLSDEGRLSIIKYGPEKIYDKLGEEKGTVGVHY